MKRHSGSFTHIHGKTQQYQVWLPQQPVQGVILIVHGLAEHSGRYMNLVNRFVPQGYAVYGFDHLGHGLSDGPRVYIDDFSQFVAGLDQMVDRVSEQHPQQPIILFGHSMGGLITSYYLSIYQHKVSAAILSAPAIEAPFKVTPLMKGAARIAAKLFPRAKIGKLELTSISRTPEVIDKYLLDPLVTSDGITIKLGYEIIRAMDFVRNRASKIALPLLVLQGTHDKLVNPQGADTLIRCVTSPVKVLKSYKGLYHELIHEPEREIVFNDMEVWLDQLFGHQSQALSSPFDNVRRIG
ncbi:alpha/beta hydrolase [Shewanella gelidii]|uniref:Monoacylglycerol lipase n=1 Tax=Shewanella gelidii TaxID=1642821 RepID=A0A917N7L0_9GAMM|nr:alpha/beta hydrolase [Shewanella gelidii]MCL1097263.1 lysophospholipase [Shewanella gelidii]GGI73726.1 monoacylglycerol lipase [Shewanella gelidii]